MATQQPLTDHELASFFKDGNETAFDRLFGYFYAPLCYFAGNIVKDSFAAEDMAQDILLKAWQKHADFEKFATLRSFLYTGVKNAGLNYLNRQGMKNRHEPHIVSEVSIEERSVLQLLIDAELTNQLFTLVETLPEQCRRVIKMTFEEGLKPVEIAAELSISVSTVNNQKMRGLRLLKDRLPNDDMGLALSLLIFYHLTCI